MLGNDWFARLPREASYTPQLPTMSYTAGLPVAPLRLVRPMAAER